MSFTVVVRSCAQAGETWSDEASTHDLYVDALRRYRRLTRPGPAQRLPPQIIMLTTLGCNADLNDLDHEDECVTRVYYTPAYVQTRHASVELSAQISGPYLGEWQRAKYRVMDLIAGKTGRLSAEDRRALDVVVGAVELIQDSLCGSPVPFGLVFPDAPTGAGPDLDARLSTAEQAELLSPQPATAPAVVWKQIRAGEVSGEINGAPRYQIDQLQGRHNKKIYRLTDLKSGTIHESSRQHILKTEAQGRTDAEWTRP